MTQYLSTEFNDKNNVISKTIDTMRLTFKVAVPHKHSPLLNSLYTKGFDVAHRDANAALNIRSRWVEQAVPSSAAGLIGDSLNQRTNEVVQLESSGGAR